MSVLLTTFCDEPVGFPVELEDVRIEHGHDLLELRVLGERDL